MRRRWVEMLILFVLATPALAQEAATQPSLSIYDGQPLALRNRMPGNSPVAGAAKDGWPDSLRWGMSLGAVLGLILLLRWAAKRTMGISDVSGGEVMKVLARLNLGPRQQLLLIQVGRRLVMAANTGGQMSALAEITNADEMAEVIGQCNRRKTTAASTFKSLFGQAAGAYEMSAESGESVEPVAKETSTAAEVRLLATRAELRGLLEKVKQLRKTGE
jgi:flagellar biogenesis protein FliO